MYRINDEQTHINPGMVIIFGLMIGAVGTSIYFFIQFKNTKQQIAKLQTSPTNVSVTEKKKDILEQLTKMVELPQNEEPTLATVTDVTKLQDQPFFANAQNGDEILIYKTSKRAIIYRPGNKKIVDMAQVNLDMSEEASESAN